MSESTQTETTEAAHSPTPWTYDQYTRNLKSGDILIFHLECGGDIPTTEEDDANGRHIVKCVNSYDRLEAELSNVKRLLGCLVQGMEWWAAQEDGIPGELAMEYTQARGALNWEYYTTQQAEALARADMNMNVTRRMRRSWRRWRTCSI